MWRPQDGHPHEIVAAAVDPLAGHELLNLLTGQTLHVYRCDSLLGRGGMGFVFLAEHEHLGRKCALKVLAPHLIERSPDYVERFLHEGQSAAALIHPNIVTVHAIGHEGGVHFLEMEYIPGRSLQRKIAEEGRLDPTQATVLTTQIADGLAAAHRQSIIHQDLKPDNVMLTHGGVAKITDFGLSKRILDGDRLVGDGQSIAGTPHFMAPEIFAGGDVSPASDVYALGVCYYVMLTGRYPFVGNSLSELIHAISVHPLPHPRREFADITLEQAECLALMLAKNPQTRPRDGIEAAQLLRAILGEARDLTSLIHDAFLDVDGVDCRAHKGSFRLTVQLANGRRQRVVIEESRHGSGDRLLLIYSLCAEVIPEFLDEALRLNATMAHGSVAIRNVDGRDMFVVVDTYPRSTVDPEEIRRSVLELACCADTVEQQLSGDDRH